MADETKPNFFGVDMAAKEPREFISPEGVEERIVQQQKMTITLTGGGKYRVYLNLDGKKDVPGKVHDTLDSAERDVACMLSMFAGLKLRPEATLDIMFKSLLGGKKDGN